MKLKTSHAALRPGSPAVRRLAHAILVGVAVGVPGLATATDGDGNYAIWGQGSRSCNQFLKTTEETEQKRFKDYTMGYLTAYNMLSDDTYSITGKVPLPQFLERLRLHCEGNQLDSFDRALKIVIAAQYEDRLRTPTGNQQSWGRAPGRAPVDTAM